MEILKINKENQKEIIKKVNKMLEEGKVLIVPTDTVYGLIADAENKKAVEKIFIIKKRDRRKAIPIFIKNIESAKKIAEIDECQEETLFSVWPGKTTVILKKKDVELYGLKKKTIALRIPEHELINKLFFNKIEFIAQTSANISGRGSLTEIEQVINNFKNQKIKPDLVIDAGNLPESKHSAIIDITKKEIKTLRE